MAVLEAVVIATIILAGAWVGYHAWQDSLHETAEKHEIEIGLDVHTTKNNYQILDSNALAKPQLRR